LFKKGGIKMFKSRPRAEDGIETIVAAIFIAGMLYITTFTPLAIYTSLLDGLDPVRVLLLYDIPEKLLVRGESAIFPQIHISEDIPFLASLGVMYGLMSIFASLFGLSIRSLFFKGGAVQLIRFACGFFLGYYWTIGVLFVFGFNKHPDIMGVIRSVFSLPYIYFGFLVAEFVKNVVHMHRVWQPSLNYLIDGLFALYVAALLSIGYDEEIAEIIAGPIFLFMTFVAMLLAEHTIVRSFLAQYLTMLAFSTEVELKMDDQLHRKNNIGGLIKFMIREFKYQFCSSIYDLHERSRKTYNLLIKTFKKHEPKDGTIVVDVPLAAALFVIWAAFPLMVGSLYHLIFQPVVW